MNILDDMGVRKLSAKVFSKVNYSFGEVSSGRSWSKINRCQHATRLCGKIKEIM